MKKWMLLILIPALAWSCSEEPKPEEKPAPPKKKVVQPKPKPKPKPKKPRGWINNGNVVERLTQYGKENPETIVDIYTTFGKVRVRLYKDTPLHRASFLLWAKKGFYNGSVFMRVAPDFIAQGGATHTDEQQAIKREIGKYTIPPEFHKHHFHKKGALGAARHYKDNPEKRSDSHRFYFVEGTRYNEPTLAKYEETNGYKYTKTQRDYYLGENQGAAHIDGQHTVFGEIISGYSVVPKLTHVETDSKDWPIDDLFIDSVKVIR
ncbi:peptidylprolyl isomerase [bacterium SCSIO 12741]|nr:peptidylprolyl isomerase [bacterium SCSIO 12741]